MTASHGPLAWRVHVFCRLDTIHHGIKPARGVFCVWRPSNVGRSDEFLELWPQWRIQWMILFLLKCLWSFLSSGWLDPQNPTFRRSCDNSHVGSRRKTVCAQKNFMDGAVYCYSKTTVQSLIRVRWSCTTKSEKKLRDKRFRRRQCSLWRISEVEQNKTDIVKLSKLRINLCEIFQCKI